MDIYLARPINGYSYLEVMDWYKKTRGELEYFYTILSPMSNKEALRTETKFRAHGYDNNPVSTNHAIIERDRWMVSRADVVFMDLSNTAEVSIGCMMELAWAHQIGKHTIVVMSEDNIHQHAFVLEAADIVFTTYEDAIWYLQELIGG